MFFLFHRWLLKTIFIYLFCGLFVQRSHEVGGGEASCDYRCSHVLNSSGEGDQDGDGTGLGSVVDGNLLLTTLESDNVTDLGLGVCSDVLNSEIGGFSKDYSSETLVGVDLDNTLTTSGQRPSNVLVGSVFLGRRLELGASDGLGVTGREFVGVSTFPFILARSVDVVPGIHEAIISLLTVGVRNEETSVLVHTSAIEARLRRSSRGFGGNSGGLGSSGSG
jgi:hypothetical protein